MAAVEQLKELGEKLDAALADPADALAKLLEQAAECLHGIEQSPGSSVMETIQSCLKAVAREELLKHQDEDVKVHLGTCFYEITRINAPEAPYCDNVLRVIEYIQSLQEKAHKYEVSYPEWNQENAKITSWGNIYFHSF